MIEKVILILELVTYFALIPIIFRAMMALDFTKLFKRDRVGEAQMAYFAITIVFAKIIGDFFITIMRLFLSLLGVL